MDERKFAKARETDPTIEWAVPRWSASELDAKIKSPGWGMAYIHVLVDAFDRHRKDLYGPDSIQNSYQHPLFPKEWATGTKSGNHSEST